MDRAPVIECSVKETVLSDDSFFITLQDPAKTHLPMISRESALKSCFKFIVISFFGIFFVFASSIKYNGPPLFPSLDIIFDFLKILNYRGGSELDFILFLINLINVTSIIVNKM